MSDGDPGCLGIEFKLTPYRWVDRLDGKLHLLSSQPMMGRARDDLSPGIRSMPFGRYVIFYEPLADGIDVIRVLHSARDIDAVFDHDPDVPESWPAAGKGGRTRVA